MKNRLLLIPLAVVLSASLSYGVPAAVTALPDVSPGAAYYGSVQSLVEKWAVVSDLELSLAAADSGKETGGYFPDAPLTRRQLAAQLSRVLEMTGPFRKKADSAVEEAILVAHKEGRIVAKTAAELRDRYRVETAAILRPSNPAWPKVRAADVKGIAADAGEFKSMQVLLEKYGTGGALLDADGSYSAAKHVSEKELTDLLGYLFQFTPETSRGKTSLGDIALDPAAPTVSRGKAARLLHYSLSQYGDALAAIAAGIDKTIAAGAKPGQSPVTKTGPKSAPPATSGAAGGNPGEILKQMNALVVEYKTGVPDLAPGSREVIEQIAELIKQLPPDAVIEIGVHTDANGRESRNERLTLNRAREVLDILCRKGIPVERLKTKGYGSSKPLASNDTEEGRVQNRRTEFSIVEP